MKEILKWPLIVAAVVIVLRVVTERAGAPDQFNNLLSAVLLHCLLGPLYFSLRLAKSDVPSPYLMLIKLVAVYVVLVRAMVIPTYWLAHIYGWTESRFSGLGPESSPFVSYIAIPFQTAAIWIVVSIVFGGILGLVVLALTRTFVWPVRSSEP
jgi:hypothetical protein